LPPLKPMVQSRCGVVRMLEAQVHPLVVAIPRFIRGRTSASITRITPRLDWAIGFNGDKGFHSWINLDIASTRGCTCASRIWTTPRRNWAIGFKGSKGTPIWINLKADGSIKAWGRSNYGGTGAPSGNGYTKIYSHLYLHDLNYPTPWLSHRLEEWQRHPS
jgi:hypothetical protein